MRFASYNVHAFSGRQGLYDPALALVVIEQLQAKVVALQEVRADDRQGLTMLSAFAREQNYELVLGPTIVEQSGHHFGNALLLKGWLKTITLHDISLAQREPRGVIEVEVELAGMAWRIFATHLGLSPSERRQQVKWLLAMLGRQTAASNTVLMGDLNEWYIWGRPLRWLKSYFQLGYAPLTFPAPCPLFALDRIWVHPAYRVKQVWALKTEQSVIASDHLPVVVELQ